MLNHRRSKYSRADPEARVATTAAQATTPTKSHRRCLSASSSGIPASPSQTTPRLPAQQQQQQLQQQRLVPLSSLSRLCCRRRASRHQHRTVRCCSRQHQAAHTRSMIADCPCRSRPRPRRAQVWTPTQSAARRPLLPTRTFPHRFSTLKFRNSASLVRVRARPSRNRTCLRNRWPTRASVRQACWTPLDEQSHHYAARTPGCADIDWPKER